MLLSGSKIGRYLVKRKLAEGGMAEIYLCAAVGPEGFEKEVAIKVVRSFLARDDGFMKMFVDEARLASRLNHANVVQIFDFAKHDDSYFIAMEYVRGVSLWDLRRRCRELGIGFPVTLAAEVGVHVARGLHYAHSLTERGRPIGLVHRDVTPHNVLISFEGAIKLTDFGIAKASGNQSSTAAGMLKGKFAYMSPEQARGEKIDSRTDVFALGIVLWEMLTGGRLFEGDSDVAVLRAVQQSYISPPARLNPDVPPELDGVIMKALERDETKRYQSAQELERALANFILRHAKSVEDTNVGMFVSQMFKDELDDMRHAEYAGRDGTESTAKEPPVPPAAPAPAPAAPAEGHTAFGATAIVERDHSKPRESAPRPADEKPKTALLPGTSPRGPLMDDDEPSQKRTDQMKEYAQQSKPLLVTPPPVVLKDSFAKEVAEASKILNAEEEAKARTTESMRRAAAAADSPAEQTQPPERPKKSAAPWLLASLVATGFIASLSYLWVTKVREEQNPIVVAPPPAPPVDPVGVKPAEPPPDQPPEKPPEVAIKAPEPAPAPVPAVIPEKPAEKAPEPAAEKPDKGEKRKLAPGTLQVDAQPYAVMSIDGKPWDNEVIGVRKFNLKPGRYLVKLFHPKRTVELEVNITSNHVTEFPVFRAIEKK